MASAEVAMKLALSLAAVALFGLSLALEGALLAELSARPTPVALAARGDRW